MGKSGGGGGGGTDIGPGLSSGYVGGGMATPAEASSLGGPPKTTRSTSDYLSAALKGAAAGLADAPPMSSPGPPGQLAPAPNVPTGVDISASDLPFALTVQPTRSALAARSSNQDLVAQLVAALAQQGR